MEPDAHSLLDREQRVRFSSKVPESPAVLFSPRRPLSSSSTKPNPPASSPPNTPRRRKQLDSSVRAAVDKFREDADPSLLLPSPKKSPHAIGVSQYSKVDKGKGRAVDPNPIPEYETSGFLRVRGKERELMAAREELDKTERQLERDDIGESSFFEHTDKDRDRDKEKIKMLEQEVERLKQEVSVPSIFRRSKLTLLQLLRRPTSFADNHHPPPPPPPPPPPLLPKKITLSLPMDSTDPNLFASARASLKQAPPPIENPINPLVSTRRPGIATIGIAPDKMASFLKEMKTVRLRKVSERSGSMGAESSFSSAANTSGVDLSSLRRSGSIQHPEFSLPSTSRNILSGNHSMSEIDTRIGDKRKRAASGYHEDPRKHFWTLFLPD